MIRAVELWRKKTLPKGRALKIDVSAPAKINLFLEVVGRRPDGYHNLETIFQEISLCDELHIKMTPHRSRLLFRCDSKQLTRDAQPNLVERAARLFCDAFDVPCGFSIALKKRVPIGAGLGGGSSDAAATLLGCAWLSRYLPHPTAQFKTKLFDLAKRLGADVSFFLHGGACLGTALGDCLKPMTTPKSWFVLVFPGFSISTAGVYRRLEAPLTMHQSIHKMKRELSLGAPPQIWARYLFNRLEDVALSDHPALRNLKEKLISLGCAGALLSGSGSSVFGVVSSRRQGETIRSLLVGRGYKVWLVSSS